MCGSVAVCVSGACALPAWARRAPVNKLVNTAAVLPVIQHAEHHPDAVPPRLQGEDWSQDLDGVRVQNQGVSDAAAL